MRPTPAQPVRISVIHTTPALQEEGYVNVFITTSKLTGSKSGLRSL